MKKPKKGPATIKIQGHTLREIKSVEFSWFFEEARDRITEAITEHLPDICCEKISHNCLRISPKEGKSLFFSTVSDIVGVMQVRQAPVMATENTRHVIARGFRDDTGMLWPGSIKVEEMSSK